jgi:hypothetical protein
MDRRTALSTWLNYVLASRAIDVEDRVVVSDIVHRMGKLPESRMGSFGGWPAWRVSRPCRRRSDSIP